jgi:diguanylate cyclase (GGDEF)-like protein
MEGLIVFLLMSLLAAGGATIALLATLLWQKSRSLQRLQSQLSLKETELTNSHQSQQMMEDDLKTLTEKITQEVLTDTLTGLPSRRVFEDNLSLTLNQSIRFGMTFGVMFLDLDEFKVINEALGHEVGDHLLKDVTARILTSVRQVDTVSRFGGDEFVFILPQLSKAETAVYVAQRLLDAIAQPFMIQGHELFITASIGIAIYPADGEDGKTLLQNANNALHQAKARGRNTYQFYRKEMYAISRRELLLSSSLQSESIYQDFFIYYQPQVNVETKKVISMGAMLRWRHPDFGWISWDDFSRLADNSGKIVAIGEWMLRSACQSFAQWKSLALAPSYISLQVSTKQIENSHFIHKISSVLQEINLDPSCVMFEIVEASLSSRTDLVEKMLPMLKHLGIQISIKNFGTGNLSLQHLKNLPIDSLKIDNTLIQDITVNKESVAIVKMIIALAKSLQINVVAEGVESAKQKQLLQELGCNLMEGELFSCPGLAEEFTKEVVEKISENV